MPQPKQLLLWDSWPFIEQPLPSNREEQIREVAVRRSDKECKCPVSNDDQIPELFWGCCLHEAFRGVDGFRCLICTLNEGT